MITVSAPAMHHKSALICLIGFVGVLARLFDLLDGRASDERIVIDVSIAMDEYGPTLAGAVLARPMNYLDAKESRVTGFLEDRRCV